MAKVISQETFNEVVQENIDEFGMTEEEAANDAVQQFEAQGVNLANIIRNPNAPSAKIIKKNAERLLELTEVAVLPEGEVLTILDELSAAIGNDMSYQLMAASLGVYTSLKKCLEKEELNIKLGALIALVTLMNNYPDLLDEEGMDLMLKNLGVEQRITEMTLNWIEVSVKKHEANRSKLISRCISKDLACLIRKHDDDVKIITSVCSVIKVLTLDDDVRVAHGQAHEHARALAIDLLPLLTSTLSKFTTDTVVAGHILEALEVLLLRNEFCITFHENNGVKHVLEAMAENLDDSKVARSGLLVLKNLAGSDEVREPIIVAGGAPIVVMTLEKHFKSSNVAIAGCMCIGALTLRSPSNSLQMATAGGPEILIRCLEHWKTNKSIMKHGCSAIRNQTARCPELCEEYRNLQVEDFLTEAKKLHGDLGFEAKSILLDLGCEIQLKEEWKGTGRQLKS